MIKPKVIKYKAFKKILESFGLVVKNGKKHKVCCGPDGKKYPFPAHDDGSEIKRCYVDGARRKFGLTPEEGISDKAFYGRK